MLYAVREPILFTYGVNFSHIASIFIFSVDMLSRLATLSHI